MQWGNINIFGQYKQRILNAGAEFKKTLECSSSQWKNCVQNDSVMQPVAIRSKIDKYAETQGWGVILLFNRVMFLSKP